ncbi:MAG: hypothetical protein AB1306_00320 [Nitrospirota bacterium]
MRNIIALLLIILFLIGGCDKQEALSKNSPSQQKMSVNSSGKPSASTASLSILTAPPEKMKDVIEAAYRLQPDRKFLLAVAEIHNFFSKEEKIEALAEFRNGIWMITYNGMDVGVLPELPDYPDLMGVLLNWGKFLNHKYPLRLSSVSDSLPEGEEINKNLEQFLSHNAISAVKQVDKLWDKGIHHPELLRLATRAMVLINMQKLDYVEIADILPAKTLAVLAVSKTLTDADFLYEESLLAYTIGYSAHASRLAERLPSTSALRHFLTREYKDLEQLAMQKNSSVESKYLWLLHIAEKGDFEAWYQWQELNFQEFFFSLPILKLGLVMNKFSLDEVIPQQLLYATILALAQDTDMPDFRGIQNKTYYDKSVKEASEISEFMLAVMKGDSSKLTGYLKKGLQQLHQKHKGTFLDADAYASYYQSYFFSALYTLGLHYIDSLSSVEATKEFAEMMGNSGEGIYADFQRWYNDLADAKAGNPNKSRLKEDIAGLPSLGVPAIYRTFNILKSYYDFGEPEMFDLAKKMVKRMDTRVYHRDKFSGITWKALHDLKLTEKLSRSVTETDPMRYHTQQVWFAGFAADEKLLKKLLYSPMLNPESRVVSLWHIEKQRMGDEHYITKEYQRLISEDPNSWEIRNRFQWFLKGLKKYKEARATIMEWIALDVTTAGLERVFAYRELAHLYYEEGRYDEGLKAIEPVTDSMQAGVMEIDAMILDKLERTKEAEEVFRKVISRYPDSLRSMALYVKFLWQHGRYAEAAKLIKEWRYPINFSGWQHTIGARFAEVFNERPLDDGLSAFSALVSEGISHWNLQYIPRPVAEAGNNELAFGMQSKLHGNGLGGLMFVTEAYNYLKNWQGKERGLEWIRERVPQHFINTSSVIFFSQAEYDLLWDLIQEPDKGEYPEFVWLLRAAAIKIQKKDKNDQRYKSVLKYFQEHNNGHYQVIGRYLLGLETEKKVLALATDAGKRCEVAYYIGLKSQADGFYGNASDWYHIAVETGQQNAGEYRWAFDILYKWYAKEKSLSIIFQNP